jgi:hypothetical protein
MYNKNVLTITTGKTNLKNAIHKLGKGFAIFSTFLHRGLVLLCMSQQINSSQVFNIASAFSQLA